MKKFGLSIFLLFVAQPVFADPTGSQDFSKEDCQYLISECLADLHVCSDPQKIQQVQQNEHNPIIMEQLAREFALACYNAANFCSVVQNVCGLSSLSAQTIKEIQRIKCIQNRPCRSRN